MPIPTMVDLFLQTMSHLEPVLRAGNLEACEKTVVEKIRQLPRSPFDLSIEVDISNDPANAAKTFDDFFGKEAERIRIAAVYTEMNGFDINSDLWFCDFFAYTSYGMGTTTGSLVGSRSISRVIQFVEWRLCRPFTRVAPSEISHSAMPPT